MSIQFNSYGSIDSFFKQKYQGWGDLKKNKILKRKILSDVAQVFSKVEIQSTNDAVIKDSLDKKLIEIFNSDLARKTPSKISQFVRKNNLNLNALNSKKAPLSAKMELINVCQKLISSRDTEQAFQFIKERLDLKNSEDTKTLFEVINLILAEPKGAWDLCEKFNHLGLNPGDPEEKETLIEIVRLILKMPEGVDSLCFYIKNFTIDVEYQVRKKIISEIIDLILGEADGFRSVCENMHKFRFPLDLDCEGILIEVINAELKQPGGAKTICDNIYLFGLNWRKDKDKKILIKITKLILKQSDGATAICGNIGRFGFNPANIEDKKILTEIFNKALVEPEGVKAICWKIDKFGLDPTDSNDKKTILQVVDLTLAQGDVETVCLRIAGFGIAYFGLSLNDPDDVKMLIKIIHLVIPRPDGSYYFVQNIDTLGVDKFGGHPSDSEGETILMKMIQLALAQPGSTYAVCSHFTKLGLKSKSDVRKVIDLILAKPDGAEALCSNFTEFKLNYRDPEDRNLLGDIVKKVLFHPEGVKLLCCNFRELGLDLNRSEDRNIFIEITKQVLSYPEGAEFLCRNLNELKWNPANSDQKNTLVQIFKLTLLQPGAAKIIFQYFKKFRLDAVKDQILITELIKRIIMDDVSRESCFSLWEANSTIFIQHDIHEREFFNACITGDSHEMEQALRKMLSQWFDGEMLNDAFNMPFGPNKLKCLKLTGYLLLSFSLLSLYGLDENILKEEISQLCLLGIFEDLFKIRQPHLRFKLVQDICSLLSSPNKKAFFALCEEAKKSRFSLITRLPLIYCFFAEINIQDLKKEKNCSIFQNQFLKNAAIQKLLLSSLHQIKHHPSFSENDYKTLMRCFLKQNGNDLKQSCHLIQTLLCFHKTGELKQPLLLEGVKNASTLTYLQRVFSEKCNAFVSSLIDVESLSASQQKALEDFGEIAALTHYLEGSVNRLFSPDKDLVFSAIRGFIEALLQGSFHEWRYDKESNPHLKQLFQDNQTLETSWRTGIERDLKEGSAQGSQSRRCIEGDAPRDLFMCVTSVQGSCLSIYGDPEINKALMGYVANGQNRIIVIKDSKGKMRARAILRILIDQEDFAALFLDRIYPANASVRERQAILDMAITKARMMNIPLYTVLAGEGESAPDVTLRCTGGRAPYDYEDALEENLCRRSQFTIGSGKHNVQQLVKGIL